MDSCAASRVSLSLESAVWSSDPALLVQEIAGERC